MKYLRQVSNAQRGLVLRLGFGIGLLWPWLIPCPVTGQPAEVVADEVSPETPSQRNANYTIEVRLDPEAKTLEGSQTVVWRNIQTTPTDELWFHLYWNGWRNNRSTWMQEDRIRGRSSLDSEEEAEDWGYLEVDSIRLTGTPDVGGMDLEPMTRFASPDDGNPDDRTVMVVSLPTPVEPGETVSVELEWRAKIPRTFARTGFRGNYFFIAHWFPKLGVFEGDAWNCHQYHSGTEYFSDYGVYDVAITLPVDYVLGATGRLVESVENEDGSVTHRHVQEDVHSFTWTTSPDYLVLTDRFEHEALPPVDLRLLIQPEHAGQAERHFHATKAALEYYGTWYGPYPYGHVTVVDPAYGSGAGGMEYPTLFTAGTRLFNPFGGGSPEGVTIHEAGHQFWYALVGNNEFEDAWLDEGLNTFSTTRTYAQAYPPEKPVRRYFTPPGTEGRGFFPLLLEGFGYPGGIFDERLGGYRRFATIDRQSTPSYLYYPSAGGALSYSKTALWLATLERYLGWDVLQPAMSRFFDEWQYRHPEPDDLFDTLSEVAGSDLSWFFEQVYHSSEEFDYAVLSVSSSPAAVEGWVEREGELTLVEAPSDEESETGSAAGADGTLYRSEVVVRRFGGGVFPVEVLMVFEDGEEVRYSWDGTDRWKRIVVERTSKLRHAVVDPDRILQLDVRPSNNSLTLEEPDREPAIKWSSRCLIWLQDLLTNAAFFG
jgi:hypothetical protein